MKKQLVAGCIIIACIAIMGCTNQKAERSGNEGETDSTESGEASEASAPTTTLTSPDTSLIAEDLFSEEGETVLEISSKKISVSNPYDFKLNPEEIKSRLGSDAVIEAEEIPSTEDYPGYTMYTIRGGNSQIKFGNNVGMHFAEIRTGMLPLKDGIGIGMSKSLFMERMSIESAEAPKASVYKLYDDYGYMNFYFKGDTLSLIRISYNEHD
jgi:hypothetical protein